MKVHSSMTKNRCAYQIKKFWFLTEYYHFSTNLISNKANAVTKKHCLWFKGVDSDSTLDVVIS